MNLYKKKSEQKVVYSDILITIIYEWKIQSNLNVQWWIVEHTYDGLICNY